MVCHKPKLSIIILAYNEEAYIGPCLEAIKQQTIAPDEIIVVDNNSTDKTVAIAKSYPFVTVIHEKEQGMIPARDAGFNVAHGDLLARIDSDTLVPQTWVETIHLILDSRSDQIVGVSGTQYLYALKNKLVKNVVSDVTSRYGFFGISKLLLGHETLFGSNMIITQHAWQKVKEEVCHDSQQVHEDIDLALHIGKYGKILLDKRLIVGISNRAFFEGSKKHRRRLKIWIKTITRHRKLFEGWFLSTPESLGRSIPPEHNHQ